MVPLVPLLALLSVVAASPAAPTTASACSDDTFSIGGRPLAIHLCPGTKRPLPRGSAPGRRASLTILETFSAGGKSFARQAPLDVLADAPVSRAIDDVALDPLGLSGALHLTIVYQNGAVRLEHALLVPGALPLK